jgi:hypothetical protein
MALGCRGVTRVRFVPGSCLHRFAVRHHLPIPCNISATCMYLLALKAVRARLMQAKCLCLHDGHRMYSLSSSSIALLAMEELLWERMQCPLCHMTADTPSTVHVEDNAPVAPARLCCACAGTRAKQTQHCAGVVTGQRARPCERRPAHAAMQAHAFLRRQTLCQQCSDPFTSARLRLHTARQHYAVFAVCIAVGDVSQQPG